MAMWSGDRPFYEGTERGKDREREKERKGKRQKKKETNTHADGHIDRWTDTYSKLEWGLVLHRKTARKNTKKVTEALL